MPKENDIGIACRDKDGHKWAERAPARFKSHCDIVLGGSGIPLENIPDDADSVRLTVATNNATWLPFGDDDEPTPTTGELLKTTDPPLLLENIGNEELYQLRFCSTAGGGTLHAIFYKVRA